MEKGTEKAWDVLKDLTDPELPFLTLDDLGVIREIKRNDKNHVVTIAPTYIGCPAISVICLLYTSPSPRDVEESRMPSSA